MTRKMKDSGVEWIGDIPEDWEVGRLSCIATIKTGSTPNQKKLNPYLGIDWVKTPNLKEEEGTDNSDLKINNYHTYNVTIAEKGSTLVSCIGDIGKMAYLEKEVSYNQQINAVTFNGNFNKKFGFYSLFAQKEQHKSLANGNVLQILNSKNQGLVTITYPSIEIQNKIVYILDKKLFKIKKIKELIKQQIQSLEDYKKSLITEAVTRGLDEDVPMKDSGIEWIGKIPEHWEAVSLKDLVTYNNKQLRESTREDYVFNYLDIGSVEYGKGITSLERMEFGKAPSRARRVVSSGDIVISTVRTYLKAMATVPENDFPIIVSTGFITLRSKVKELDQNFLAFAVQSELFISEIESRSTGVSYPAINPSELVQIKILLPTINEQKQIVSYLDKKCSTIDGIIRAKEKQLEILEDYKKSLIYEYVTGKKEVDND